MRYIIAAFLLMGAFVAQGQSVLPFRADTIKFYKVGGYAEFVLLNKTKDSLGVMINTGNGKTEFRRAKKLDSTHIIIGLDTLEIGSGSGSGADSSIFATLYRLDTAKINLRAADALKLNITDTTGKWYSRIYRSNDSVYGCKNTTCVFLYKDSVGGGGTGTDTAMIFTGGLKRTSSTNVITVSADSLLKKTATDLGVLPDTRIYVPATGISAAGTPVTNYGASNLDSATWYLNSGQIGSTGKYGGILWPGTLGDSVRLAVFFGVVIGDSQPAGHTQGHNLFGRLETTPYVYNYPDSQGQISWRLKQLTNYWWYNQGYGSETTIHLRQRWARDVLGDSAVTQRNPGGIARTLSRKPGIVIIMCGVNDPFNNIPPSVTMANLEYFAASCQQNGILCIICNIGGSGTYTGAQINSIVTVNRWLATGALDKYNASIFDYHRFWNDPTHGENPIYPSSFVSGDLIHPTAVGYDSLAYKIDRECKVPHLTKIVVATALDPTSPPANYSRPNAFTLNGVAYSSPATGHDTITITSPLNADSIWLKTTGSTPVTGTSVYGYSSGFKFYLTNNPNNDSAYTRRTRNSNGATNSDQNISSIQMQVKNSNNSNQFFNVIAGDGSTVLGRMESFGSNVARFYWNRTSIIGSNDVMSISGDVSMTGAAAAGANSKFGSLQLANTTTASVTGNGIGLFNNAIQFETASGFFRFSGQNTRTPSRASSNNALIGMTFADAGAGDIGNTDTVFNTVINPRWNNTSTGKTRGFSGGLFIKNDTTLMGNQELAGIMQINGNNYFNVSYGNTVFGATATNDLYTKVIVNGTAKVTDTFKTPNIARRILDTTNYKPEVVDASGNHFKTDWANFGSSNASAAMFKPTMTNVLNCTGISIDSFFYQKINNIVTVTAYAVVDCTSDNTSTQFTMTLPFASTLGGNDVFGTGIVQGPGGEVIPGVVMRNGGDFTKPLFAFKTGTGNGPSNDNFIRFSFTYKIN